MVPDQTQGKENDQIHQLLASLTLLSPAHREEPKDLADTFDSLQRLSGAETAPQQETISPLNVPKWVWALPVANAKIMFVLWMAGSPLVGALFFGFIDIIMIGVLIFMVYSVTGAGQGCSDWLANGCKRPRRTRKSKG